jgi:hypothetical protein
VGSLHSLSELLKEQDRIQSPRMLQTVVFLAQTCTGKHIYKFRASHGKVVSDELDQDAAILEARGMLQMVCSFPERRTELHVNRAARPQFHDEDQGELADVFEVARRLLSEDTDVLEGAAALCRLNKARRPAAIDRLSWYRNLSAEKRRDAEELFRTLVSTGKEAERSEEEDGPTGT